MNPTSARFNGNVVNASQRFNQLQFTVTYDNGSSKSLVLHINERQDVIFAGLCDAESDSRGYNEVDPDFWKPLFRVWQRDARAGNEFGLRVDKGQIVECALREANFSLEEDNESFFDMSEKVRCRTVHTFYGAFFKNFLPAVALYPYSFLNAENERDTSMSQYKRVEEEESSNLNLRNILLAIPLTIPAVITMLCAAALAALAILAAPLIYGGALFADSVCSEEPSGMVY